MQVFPYDQYPDGGGFLPVTPGTTPHTIIEVDDLDVGVSFITVWRDDGARWQEVRGAIMAPVVGAWAGVDWECGFNRVTSYRVEQFDAAGLTLGFLPAASTTLTSTESWVQNVLAPRDGVAVQMTDKAFQSIDRPYDADLVYARGAAYGTVVGSARRGIVGLNVEMVTESLGQADKVQALLGGPGNELPSVLCVRKGKNELTARIPHTLYVHTPSINEVGVDVRFGGEMVVHEMAGTEAKPPALKLGTPLLTRADLSAAYVSRAARSADNISRAAASRRWDLAGYASV